MKICWLENGNFVGGAELFSAEMLSALPKGSEVTVVIGEDNAEVKLLFKKRKKLLIEVLPIPSLKLFSFSSLSNFWKAVWKLRMFILENEFDMVYANTVRTALVLRVAKMFLPSHIETAYFAHDYTFPKRFAGFFLHSFTKRLACSYGVKKYLMDLGMHSSQVEVVPNGVSLEKFASIAPITRPARKVGCLGRIANWKGQLTVLHAAYLLKESHHELPFRFFFFGVPGTKPEDQEYFEHLKYFTKEHGLEGIVQFCGFVPPEKAMEEIDIVVHSAEEAEPFGRVPLEAAAAKRILCVSNIGTPAQIFEDKKNALFFEPADARSLAEKLMEAYHNAPQGEELIENAYTLVQEEFDLKKIQEKFWRVLTPGLW